VKRLSVTAKAYKCDVSNYDAIVKLRASIEKDLGPVDILINNAGLILFKTFMDNSHVEIERLLRVNINSNVYVSSFFEKYLQKQSSKIFFNSHEDVTNLFGKDD
jgi:all-trans-retinol dehydrogenase (NAD+)